MLSLSKPVYKNIKYVEYSPQIDFSTITVHINKKELE